MGGARQVTRRNTDGIVELRATEVDALIRDGLLPAETRNDAIAVRGIYNIPTQPEIGLKRRDPPRRLQ